MIMKTNHLLAIASAAVALFVGSVDPALASPPTPQAQAQHVPAAQLPHPEPPHGEPAIPSELTIRVPAAVNLAHTLSGGDLRRLQGQALGSIDHLFTNKFGDDVRLLDAVHGKKDFYKDVLGAEVWHPAANVRDQQTESLKVLLLTFKGTDHTDVSVRGAALDKIAKIGGAADVWDVMPLVRRPPHSADLAGGVDAVNSILARSGSPVPRGSRFLTPDVRRLLSKDSLTDDERTKVIEDVLQHGDIASVTKDGSEHTNPVFFITFNQTIPDGSGRRMPIRGVYKPEKPFVDQQKPFFTREVAEYDFERDFAKTGMVPVTVEAFLSPDQVPGDAKAWGLGSIQYMVPNGVSIGKVGYLKPEFGTFLRSPEGQRQMNEVKAHLFVTNDPEKLRTNWAGQDNWGNILAAPDPSKPGQPSECGGPCYKLYLIDNGTAMGALTRPTGYDPYGRWVNPDMLPPAHTATIGNLAHANQEAMRSELAPLVGDWDAGDVVNRVKRTLGHP
jgi:catechol 2,3-dioxygenase-like lactoylglutathione lyase family enzyme